MPTRRRLVATFLGLVLAATLSACLPSPADPSATPDSPATPVPAAPASPWPRLPAPTDLPADRPLRVAFLVVNGVYNTELAAPYDVFNHTIYQVQPGMETFTVSPDGAPITTAEGLVLQPRYSFATAPAIDVLVVPSAEHSRDQDRENHELVEWVRKVGGEARYVVSLCWGAFILAEAGLLDGHAATTFPTDHDLFAQTFPAIDVRREVTFVHDRNALTSQGGVRSYDVAMYLVDHLYGEAAARGIGGGLLIPWPPGPEAMPAAVAGES